MGFPPRVEDGGSHTTASRSLVYTEHKQTRTDRLRNNVMENMNINR